MKINRTDVAHVEQVITMINKHGHGCGWALIVNEASHAHSTPYYAPYSSDPVSIALLLHTMFQPLRIEGFCCTYRLPGLQAYACATCALPSWSDWDDPSE
jgi:hypothetical protein